MPRQYVPRRSGARPADPPPAGKTPEAARRTYAGVEPKAAEPPGHTAERHGARRPPTRGNAGKPNRCGTRPGDPPDTHTPARDPKDSAVPETLTIRAYRSTPRSFETPIVHKDWVPFSLV